MKTDIMGTAGVVINAGQGKVWQALTDPALIKQYFFGTLAKSDWTPGSPLTFEGEYQGKKYQDKGTIIKAEPGQLLSYSYWSSMSGIEDKPENYIIVTFTLQPEGDATLLIVTQQNIPTEAMRTHSIDNWKKVLNGIKDLLENA